MNKRLRTGLIVMISLVWAINFAMPLFRTSYQPPAEINIAFMGVVGLLTAGYGRNGNDENNGSKGMTTQQWRPPPPGWTPPWEQTPEPPPADPPPRAPAKKTAAKKTAAKRAPAKKTVAKKTAAKSAQKRQR